MSEDETVRVELFAGIRNSGLVFSALQYPFTERVVFDLDFRPGETVEVDLEYEYVDDVVFDFLEDFELSQSFGIEFNEEQPSGIFVTTDPEDVAYGSSAARIDVNSDNFSFTVGTPLLQTEQFGGSQVFLEVDFKTDVPFVIGFVGYGELGNFEFDNTITLNPSDEWKKLHLNLSTQLNGGIYESYQLLLRGGPLLESGTILLDNFKLVYICLLYTSPSPRDQRGSRMPSSA